MANWASTVISCVGPAEALEQLRAIVTDPGHRLHMPDAALDTPVRIGGTAAFATLTLSMHAGYVMGYLHALAAAAPALGLRVSCFIDGLAELQALTFLEGQPVARCDFDILWGETDAEGITQVAPLADGARVEIDPTVPPLAAHAAALGGRLPADAV